MKNKKKFRWLGLIVLILAAFCMITIFILSSQNNTNTNNLSEKVTEKIAKLIFFDYEKMSQQTLNEIILGLNKFIRKLAHFTMYYVLGFSLFLASIFLHIKNRYRFLIIIGISVVYAVSDEFHQLFVPGRTALWQDVIIDSFGAFLGVLCCFALFAVIEKVLHKSIL